MKTETVNPTDLMVGETIIFDGSAYTVGKDTVKTSFYGATVRGRRVKTVERVLFPKFYNGVLLGFVSIP